jgi:HSP20 family protein
MEGTMSRWDPFEEFTELRNRMDDLFSRGFGATTLSRILPTEPVSLEPEVDIYDTPTTIEFFAALPGFAPECIQVEVAPTFVVIQGERKPLYSEKAVAYRKAWVATPVNFTAHYTLPSEVEPSNVIATFSNGVLHLVLTKTELSRGRIVKVDIVPA